jgi:RNA polymerase-binding transcription factor DksA
VQQALRRIRCGGQIASGRLEARPEAALCINCARDTA